MDLRPTEGPCSEFCSTGAVIDARTCESALDLWEKRDQSISDCGAVGGVNYEAGTCYLPPQSRQQKDFCFPPVRGDDIMSLGPHGTCGVWSVEIRCERFSNFVTDPICRHREGILKVAGYALIPAAILTTVATGGAAGAPTAGAILSLTSGSLLISAEVLDGKPCRSQRVTVTAVLVIFGGWCWRRILGWVSRRRRRGRQVLARGPHRDPQPGRHRHPDRVLRRAHRLRRRDRGGLASSGRADLCRAPHPQLDPVLVMEGPPRSRHVPQADLHRPLRRRPSPQPLPLHPCTVFG